jgi:hypothetical protein
MIADLRVTQKVFGASGEPVVDGEGLTVKDVTKLKVGARAFAVRSFTSYEFDGHTFAYGVSLVPVIVEENIQTYAGAMYDLLYTDEDGDGNFETRSSGIRPPVVPEWVKTAGDKSRRN